MIQDLLGDQLDLGSAVIEMLDLGSGSLETGEQMNSKRKVWRTKANERLWHDQALRLVN